jgi:mono/diheme cytochrome c family protein
MRIVMGVWTAIVLLAGCQASENHTNEIDIVTRETGPADFMALCASCHGASGTGDGPAASGLSPRPADLTRLSAQNGGAFPLLEVMARVDGYTSEPGTMPEFGQLFADELVPFETAPGVLTPTPPRLIALARHVESLQR